jgi:hypothetical protein
MQGSFRQLEILPLKTQYIFSVMLFVLKNRNFFITNHDRHNVQPDIVEIYIFLLPL